MAYYPRKQGLEQYTLAKAAKDCNCFICHEEINRGEPRYRYKFLSLCTKCAECWEKEGGKLGDISRAKPTTLQLTLR